MDSERAASSASAQIFASTDDLLIQVFVRIPLKQVFRLKLVSQHWHSIISDPKLHLSLRKPEPAAGLIFNCIYDHKGKHPYRSYILYFDKPTIPKKICPVAQVFHSCNGLLLRESFAEHYVYNPITKKTSTLHFRFESKIYIRGLFLAFEPSESSCHYKVVCVLGVPNPFARDSPDRFSFEVYSSETGSWRKGGKPFSATVDFKEGGVYWKGAIHWVSETKSGKSIYFNPSDDHDNQMLPTEMPSPPILGDSMASSKGKLRRSGFKTSSPAYEGRNYHFGESCGHLNFIDSFRKEFVFNVYEMKMDYSEWYVKYRVDLSNVVDLFCICTLVRGNKDNDSFLVLRVGKTFIRCNLVDKTCETIYECEGIDPELENELLGHDGEFPHHYIEGAYGNQLDGKWYTEEEIISLENRPRGLIM